jgi:hypothetical protein
LKSDPPGSAALLKPPLGKKAAIRYSFQRRTYNSASRNPSRIRRAFWAACLTRYNSAASGNPRWRPSQRAPAFPCTTA